MTRRLIPWEEALSALCGGLRDDRGVFLVACDSNGRPNPMTISWAQIGVIWSRPILTVLARKSRYTHGCLLASDTFSVNVPRPGELTEELLLCGTRSGRDLDKAEACRLTLCPGILIPTPYVDACQVHFECRIAARKQLVVPDLISADLRQEHYPTDDPHLLVMGEVVGAYSHA